MFYLLWRGKITGPLTKDKIIRMIKNHQISYLYKVSEDQVNWKDLRNHPLFSEVIIEKRSSPKPSIAHDKSQHNDITISPLEKTPQIKIKEPLKVIKDNSGFLNPTNVEVKEEILVKGNVKNSTISCPLCGAEGINVSIPGDETVECRYCFTVIPVVTNFCDSDSSKNDRLVNNFPGYEIEKVLGRGGMGTVYKATQTRLNNREVALKILSSEMAGNNQLENEVAALVRLAHPSIVTIFDLVSSKDQTAIVMELILGPGGTPQSLRDIMNLNSIIPDYSAPIAACRAICKPLSYAHKQGIFHLDLKPENILIDHFGHLKLVDFGIARFDEKNMKSPARRKMTISSDVYGTIGYSAPERGAADTDPNANQDVYSLGAIFYELLTGNVPEGRFDLPSEVDPSMPPILDSLIETALNYHPERRFNTIDAMDNALANAAKVIRAGTHKSKKMPAQNLNGHKSKNNIVIASENNAVAISIKNKKIRIR